MLRSMAEPPVEIPFTFTAGRASAPMQGAWWRLGMGLWLVASVALLASGFVLIGGLALILWFPMVGAGLVRSACHKADTAVWVLTRDALERRSGGSVWSVPYAGIRRIELDRNEPDEGIRLRVRASDKSLRITGTAGSHTISASLIWFREFHRTLIALCEAEPAEREEIVRRARAHWTEGGTLPFADAPARWKAKGGS